MAEEIKIDKHAFHERLGLLISAWKSDKRSGDSLFGGVGSILIVFGKADDGVGFQKTNAMHVGWISVQLELSLSK
jgi:nucleosome binding factor SPN SPT16 subunit